jgi:hypothetical protein
VDEFSEENNIELAVIESQIDVKHATTRLNDKTIEDVSQYFTNVDTQNLWNPDLNLQRVDDEDYISSGIMFSE